MAARQNSWFVNGNTAQLQRLLTLYKIDTSIRSTERYLTQQNFASHEVSFPEMPEHLGGSRVVEEFEEGAIACLTSTLRGEAHSCRQYPAELD